MGTYFDINGTAMVHIPLTEAIRNQKLKKKLMNKSIMNV